jgi:hypothetical protein
MSASAMLPPPMKPNLLVSGILFPPRVSAYLMQPPHKSQPISAEERQARPLLTGPRWTGHELIFV